MTTICGICNHNKPHPHFISHWGFKYVCDLCRRLSRQWPIWDEEDLVVNMSRNAHAIAIVFRLINTTRKRKRALAATKRARQIMNETRITRGHQRILPNLRRSKLKDLGYTI